MQQPFPKLTPTEFLAWEREQPTRHHYVGGEIFDMSGGSARHNRLGARIITAIEGALRSDDGCGTFSSDQKIGLGDAFVYADATVACSPLQFRPGTKDVLTNPVVVVEVLSKSTMAYDRGDKQSGYLALPSLRHFVLVSQHEARVELYTRQDDGSFRFEIFEAGSKMPLVHPRVVISVDALYAGVFELPGDA